MSRQIDEKVVEMRFDNQQFEKNVKTSMSTIDKLKQSLNLDGAAKGLDSINKSASNFNKSGLSGAIDTIHSKFSALEVMGVTALANITNSAVNAGKKIVSSFTIDPIKTGFQEYETQINAVQTILSNTRSKGTTLDDVNGALDELNKYADKTIYNFTEMTRNIGTFTAAGVDLDTSVSAIKGIANLAAVSGSTSQQASTAMYQLSQALSSGTVKLQDWNSVVNAGMGGQVFQDALKETARIHGIAIDDMIKSEGSFRETLSKGWLSSEILTETLNKFTGDLTESQLISMGYTKEQASEILALGEDANNAATKVKTFTQLMDTLKEAAQSGWTQTWEILIGDFEEAKELLTSFSDVFGEIINKSSESRNKVLQGWKDLGGRKDLIDSFNNIFDSIMNIVGPIKDAFRDIFPPVTSERLKSISNGFKELTAKVKEFTEKHGKQIYNIFKGLFSVFDIGVTLIKKIVSGIGTLIEKFSGVGGGILGAASSIGKWISGIRDSIKETDIFGTAIDKIVGFLGKCIDKLKEIKDYLGNKIKSTNLESFSKILESIWNVIKKIGSAVGKVFGSIGTAIGDAIKNGNLKSLIDLFNGGVLATILLGIKKWIGGLKSFTDEGKGFLGNIKAVFDQVGGILESWQQNIKAGTLLKIAGALGILAISLLVISTIDTNKLGSSLSAIGGLFVELIGAMAIFNKIGGKTSIGSSVGFIAISTAILILVGAVKKLSSLSVEELEKGIAAVGAILLEFAAFTGLIKRINPKKMFSSAVSLVIIGAAMEIFANVCKKFSSFEWSDLGKAGAAIGGILLIAAGFGELSKYTKKMFSSSVSLVIIGAAMEIFANVCKKFGDMEWSDLGKAGAAIGGILLIAAGFGELSKYTKKMFSSSVSLVIIGAAMEIFANVCKKFGDMEWESLGKAGAAIGGLLLIVAGFSLLSGLSSGIIASSFALLIMSVSLNVLVPVLKNLGSMSWGEIAKGLAVLAASFAIFGIAGYLLAPVAPVLLALGGAILLFGVACLAVGAGISLLAAGLLALSTITAAGATAIVASLSAIIIGILELIPSIINVITEIIVAICQAFIQAVPAIAEAIKVTITELVGVLVECTPIILDGLVQLLDSLIEYMPQIIEKVANLLVIIFNGLAEKMPQLISGIINFLVSLMNSVAQNISPLIEAGVNLLSAVFQGIADAVGPLVESLFGPVLEFFENIIVGIVNAIAPYIPEITECFATMTQIISDAIVKIIEILAPYMPNVQAIVEATTIAVQAICDAFISLVEQISPIIDSITQLVQELGDSITQILDEVEDIIVSVGDVIKETFEGISDTITSIGDTIKGTFEGISNVITSVGDSIKNVLDGIAGIIDSIGNAALNAGTGFEKLANGVKTITELNLLDMAASLGEVAIGVADIAAHSGGIAEVGDGMHKLSEGISISASSFSNISNGLSSMVSSLMLLGPTASLAATAIDSAFGLMISNVKNKSSQFSSAGMLLMNQLSNGIKIGLNSVKSSVILSVSNAYNAVKSEYYSMYNSGQYLGEGLVYGINSKQNSVYWAAYALGQKAVQGEKDGQKSNSPSKLTIQSGKWFGEGLVIGIDKMGKSVYNAGYNMGDTAVNSLSKSISKISDVVNMDIDTQPTIRPVLDLTDVTSGANSIGKLFNQNQSIGVLANVNAISSSMNNRQNRTNDDVVSAIKDLNKNIGSSSNNTYNINGLTYDDGTEVSDAIQTLIRAARIERRA